MVCEQHLALTAILTGLRRTGVIDRQAMRTIVAALEEAAGKAAPHCEESAAGLTRLAASLRDGPGKGCSISIAA